MCILKEMSQDQAIDLSIFFCSAVFFSPFQNLIGDKLVSRNTDVTEDTF